MTAPLAPTDGLNFDLEEIARELRAEPLFESHGQTARTLIRTADLRVVVVALKAGKAIAEHHANVTASVQPLMGTLTLRIGEKATTLKPLQVFVMASGLAHDVVADTDCCFLLTLGWQDASK